MDNAQHPKWHFVLTPLGWVLAVALILYVFPPFHIRPLRPSAVPSRAAPGAIDVPRFAETFWSQKLVSPAIEPADAHVLVTTLTENPAQAAEKYGHRAGIGGKAYFLVAGEGRVSSVDRRGVWLSVDGANAPRLVLITGPVFGNALRDVTGLLDIKDYSSFDFNALGAELNRLAETRTQPALRSAGKVGAMLTFIAAGEIDDASGEQPVLKLAPISVSAKQ